MNKVSARAHKRFWALIVPVALVACSGCARISAIGEINEAVTDEVAFRCMIRHHYSDIRFTSLPKEGNPDLENFRRSKVLLHVKNVGKEAVNLSVPRNDPTEWPYSHTLIAPGVEETVSLDSFAKLVNRRLSVQSGQKILLNMRLSFDPPLVISQPVKVISIYSPAPL
jgi:hypothetical protein